MERLKKIGNVKSKSASEICQSRLGIGFEKLDRAVFDPEKAYDKVAAIGVKWIRIQSGWARTEKEKGVYELPETMINDAGCGEVQLINVPISDTPKMLVFGDFIDGIES